MLNARYIIIEGNIGSGKTSLAAQLANHYKSALLLEEFADNSFLPKFYENPDRWAFPLELSFLADRYHQMKKAFAAAAANQSLIISDYLFDKSLIFAKNNLNHNEISLYETFFNIVNENLPKPDLIVFIDNSIEGLQINIKKRARDFEKNISFEYLEKISSGYRQFIAQSTHLNWLLINGGDYDFVNESGHFDKIRASIESALINDNRTLFNIS